MELATELPDWLLELVADSEHAPAKVQAMLRKLSARQLVQLDQVLGIERELLADYVMRVSPGFVRMKWLDPVFELLQQLVDGEISRLIIEAPPRHGKSFIVSEHLPAYYLTRFPWRWAALVSHSSNLARQFSRKARMNYMKGGGRLHPTSRAVDRWQTVEGMGDGGMWARGIDGGITGEGSGLMVLDDPVKSRKAIRTPQARRDLGETYRDVIYTRLEADGSVVLMATRWHKEDLTGQVLTAEMDSEELNEGWIMLSRPARREAAPAEKRAKELPPTVRVIPDTRAEGEALAPERGYTVERLKKIERVVGPSTFGSLYQQDPRPMDGALFTWEALKNVPATHGRAWRVRYWDLAKSDDEGDFTAGAFISYNPDSPTPVIIEDVVAQQFGPGRRNNFIRETARADAKKYGVHGFKIWFERLGKNDAKELIATLGGYIVESESASGQGNKSQRAYPLASQAQVGNVGLIVGSWNDAFREEACAFPNSEHDDRVDAAAGAYSRALDLYIASGGSDDDDDFTPV